MSRHILEQFEHVAGKRVVVGMSGGVDSSLTAALLLEAGAKVVGAFMHNFEDDSDDCPAHRDWQDACRVAEKLGIEIDYVNLAADYDQEVFQPFLQAIQDGLTPNPDILCNQYIKFGSFLEYVGDRDADYVATGHYARVVDGRLHTANSKKDQSYFLARVQPEYWAKTLFPLGAYADKSTVREDAKSRGIPVFDKRDSQGICFIGSSDFPVFLRRFLEGEPGDIVDENGTRLGAHRGLIFYTTGQRRGIGIGGVRGASEDPWFVVERDWDTQKLVVSQDRQHPALSAQSNDSRQP